MDAVIQLRKLFKPNVKRSDQLIVSSICGKTRQLGTDTWSYPVDYAFRDALDIKPTPRVKTKKDRDGKTILDANGKPQKVRHIVWTQGPRLAFKEGDLIEGLDVVVNAAPMGWDPDTEEMYLGHVTLGKFYQLAPGTTIIQDITWEGNQLDFLELLITGDSVNATKY